MPLFSTFATSSIRAVRAGVVLLPPNVPTSFTATGASANNDIGGAVVTFTAPNTEGGIRPVTSYQVENQNTGVITTVVSGSTVPLAKNVTNTFRVRAVNSAGTSAWSSGDNALSFRTTYGGGNGYYESSTHLVNLPTTVTINYSLSSGAGSTSTPDTRTYGNVYGVTLWYDNYGYQYDIPSQIPYQYRSLGNYGWWGGYDSDGQYIEGNYTFAFGGYPNYEYWYGYEYYRYGTTMFGVYTYQTTGVTGGNAPRGPDYGGPSYLYDHRFGYISSTIAQTGYGNNLSPNTITGTIGAFTGVSTIRLDLGAAYYNYYYGGVEAYYGPSGRATIWYGT